MRRTALALMPLARAIRSAVQWVVSTGGWASGSATTRAATSGPSGGMREGRVLSCVPAAAWGTRAEPHHAADTAFGRRPAGSDRLFPPSCLHRIAKVNHRVLRRAARSHGYGLNGGTHGCG